MSNRVLWPDGSRNAALSTEAQLVDVGYTDHWVLGYSTGAARGYYTQCPVSVLPPKTIVGSDQLSPDWKVIHSAYPNAQDAFSSPTHDLLLVFSENVLQVAEIRDGKICDTLTQLQIEGHPVMVQWATGKYVEEWTKELQPYFEDYKYVSPSDLQQAEARQKAEAHNARGGVLMRQQKYDAAANEFAEADLTEPGNPEFLNNLGYSYYKTEDFESAVRYFGEALEADPKRAVAYLNRADAFVKLQRYAEAHKDYLKFLELAPSSKSAPNVKKKLDALPSTP